MKFHKTKGTNMSFQFVVHSKQCLSVAAVEAWLLNGRFRLVKHDFHVCLNKISCT